MDIKSRLKNYGLWISIVAFISMLFKAFGKDVLPSNYNEIVTAILSILVMLGLINNPTSKNRGFLDDK